MTDLMNTRAHIFERVSLIPIHLVECERHSHSLRRC